MTDGLAAGAVTDAATLALAHEPVNAAQTVSGAPTTGLHELDATTGVWEMSVGAMRDVEIDELFVVIAGDATVQFSDPPRPPIELRPGSVVRLEAGMHTEWTVRETLRKVYIAL